MTGVVIDPVREHQYQECWGSRALVMARACFVFELGAWRRRMREAHEREDWEAVDRLDREYERIGLP